MMKKFNKKPLFLRKEKWYKKGGKSLKKNTWTAKKKRFKFKLRLKWIHFFCWLYKKVISSLEINFSLFLFSNRKKTLTPSHWSKVRKWNFRNVISKDNDVIMFAFAYKQESEIITMKWEKKEIVCIRLLRPTDWLLCNKYLKLFIAFASDALQWRR